MSVIVVYFIKGKIGVLNIIEKELNEIKPQKGAQEAFLISKADIVCYGGAAGGGKTFALLLECLRNIHIKGFTGVVFRKNSTQVRNPGGLWDSSYPLFMSVGGEPKQSVLEWNFPNSKIKFSHLDTDKDKYSHQGAEYCSVFFDELCHFTYSQFVYMLSRNRSTCGVKPYVRATCNPDSDSWVRKFIDWWINEETGYPIPERSGVVRYFITVENDIIWDESEEKLIQRFPKSRPKSFTFINSTIYDNQILLEQNPEYLANLQALPKFEREQLLHGNWNIQASSGMFFKKLYFEVVKATPKNTTKIRYWDRASTKDNGQNDPDWTVGLRLEKDQNNILYVSDIVRLRGSPLEVQQTIKNIASQDGYNVRIGIEQDAGQAGVSEADYLVRQLSGYIVTVNRVSKDKITRALPVSSQCEAGNVKVLEGKWNDDFFKELENFPEGSHDDQVDCLSGAFNLLEDEKYNLKIMSGW